jgi:hypothetical protein
MGEEIVVRQRVAGAPSSSTAAIRISSSRKTMSTLSIMSYSSRILTIRVTVVQIVAVDLAVRSNTLCILEVPIKWVGGLDKSTETS